MDKGQQRRKRVVVLTGAGISAESGIKTFRDAGGLWQGHDIMEVASPDGWKKNPSLVLDFYNVRRRQLHKVQPNQGHHSLVALEKFYDVQIVTQNVDNLHEKAGSSNVIHLHGELFKARSDKNPSLVYPHEKDIHLEEYAEDGAQLRPHIVWFGEPVPMLEVAATHFRTADIALVIGTSMQVYPAAGLIELVRHDTPVYYIDPKPFISYELGRLSLLHLIPKKASIGVPAVVRDLVSSAKERQ